MSIFDDDWVLQPSGPTEAELTVERVLRAVEQVPRGRVVAYSDIATLVGTSPRRVGSIMAGHGGEVAWWRVTNRDGALPSHLLALAKKHWQREGIEADETRCRINRHRADLDDLALGYQKAVRDLG